MRLLITGAGGFLGRNALLGLPRDWQITAMHRPGDVALPGFVRARGLAHVRPLACELTDPAQVRSALESAGGEWDACLYLASNTSIPASIERPAYDLTNNTLALLHLLDAAERIEHLVYLSSGAVYNGHIGAAGPETPLAPALPYAISKAASERYIQACARYHGAPRRATIVRFFGAYGPYEPPRKLYTKLVRRFAIEREPEFMVAGDGENYIDAMYVDDAIHALRAVLEAPADGVITVDLGVSSRETVNQVVRRAAEVFGIEPRVLHTGDAPEYITFFIDPAPFAQRYGFEPAVALEDGLRRLADHLAGEEHR